MTRTLLLAERPFRDLRSRALLALVRARVADPAPLLTMTGAPRCPPGFEAISPDADPTTLGLSHVIIAGVFAGRALLERSLATAARVITNGARLDVLGFSVERSAARRGAPAGLAVLDAAAVIEAREHHTANALLVWRLATPARIEAYPERHAPADPALAADLPEGAPVGLGILGDEAVRQAWADQAPSLSALLAPWRGRPILPLPADLPGAPSDDMPGSTDFAAALLPGAPMLLPRLADPVWRRRRLTPERLKGLVARCAAVVTNQDLVAVQAVACGVPVIDLALGPDRRIVSAMAALANDLAPGSRLVFPPYG